MEEIAVIPVILVLVVSIFATTNSVLGSAGLKVYVSLFNEGGQPATICVFTVEQSAGCSNYSATEYNLHMLVPFVFNPGAVTVGQSFTACASINPGSNVCADGVNGAENEPERVTIKILSGGVQQQPTISDADAWYRICNVFQQALFSSCDSFFNSDGSFSATGELAAGCIRNGLILAGFGLYLGVPPGMGTDALSAAADVTGCGNIVKMDTVKSIVTLNGLGDIGTLLSILQP